MRKQLTKEEKQKRRKFRIVASIVGIAVIAVAITAYQYYVEHSEWLEHIPLFPAEMQSITELTCRQGEDTRTCTRDGSGWSAPWGEAAADALKQLTAIHVLVCPGTLSEYGLDDASATTVTAKDEAGRSVTVLLGSLHGNNCFARLPDGEDIYLVSRTLADALQ